MALGPGHARVVAPVSAPHSNSGVPVRAVWCTQPHPAWTRQGKTHVPTSLPLFSASLVLYVPYSPRRSLVARGWVSRGGSPRRHTPHAELTLRRAGQNFCLYHQTDARRSPVPGSRWFACNRHRDATSIKPPLFEPVPGPWVRSCPAFLQRVTDHLWCCGHAQHARKSFRLLGNDKSHWTRGFHTFLAPIDFDSFLVG